MHVSIMSPMHMHGQSVSMSACDVYMHLHKSFFAHLCMMVHYVHVYACTSLAVVCLAHICMFTPYMVRPLFKRGRCDPSWRRIMCSRRSLVTAHRF